MHIPKAVSLKVASTLMFALMGAQVRFLGGAYPVGEVAFCRALFRADSDPRHFRPARRIARSPANPNGRKITCFAASTASSGRSAPSGPLARIPLADFTAIAFIAPLLTVIFAALFLKEQVRIYRWSAVAVGFGGVILMLSPYLGGHMDLTSSVLLWSCFCPYQRPQRGRCDDSD